MSTDRRGARQILNLVASKWAVPVVRCLTPGSLRPSELMTALDGISQKVLTQTLRRLESRGLIDRTVHATVPPRVDYALTPLGLTLIEPLAVLERWVEEYGSQVRLPPIRSRAVIAEHPGTLKRQE